MEPLAHYGLIVDGTNMAIAYKDFPNLLRNVGQNCEAVVCCRMSPLQKSEVISFFFIQNFFKSKSIYFYSD